MRCQQVKIGFESKMEVGGRAAGKAEGVQRWEEFSEVTGGRTAGGRQR
jgi:hypothetical protein